MVRRSWLLAWSVLTILASPDLFGKNEITDLSGAYLGQTPPGKTPELFAPGVVSTFDHEVNSVFSPDGNEFYFAKFVSSFGYMIMVMHRTDEGWTRPRVAPFSGNYSEVDICIAPDGQTMFYVSKRPAYEDGPRSAGYRIWQIERHDNEWTNARLMGPNVNPGHRQLYPTVTRDGTLYFNSDIDGFGKGDFYRSPLVKGAYAPAENLGSAINTEYDETDILVAPDESFVIFTSVARPDGFGSGDLYVSFRQADGSWSKSVNMGAAINTSSSEFCPMLSPDGKYLFFSSRRRGNDDIYWLDAGIIDDYRKAPSE